MAKLACRTCGRQVYRASPVETLIAGERRCPRCGAQLEADRRLEDRRHDERRIVLPTAAGPPAGVAERRVTQRRTGSRRQLGNEGWRPR
jgi:DNA-directed RNA polymerase subunit RPC12/RpoP